MRNVFDQYSQPENQLTHALACTLSEDQQLLKPFLKWAGINPPTGRGKLKITEQQIPGASQDAGEEEYLGDGLPDMIVFTEDGWATLFECKVQAPISQDQLKRHRQTAAKHDFPDPHVVVIAVDRPSSTDAVTIYREWRQVYAWFNARRKESTWAKRLTDYMEVFESKMISQGYGIRGTITMFDGLKFDDDNPYNYREAKRLIKLLRDELVVHSSLQRLGINPASEGRDAITGSKGEAVWDFISLRGHDADAFFTAHPHLTIDIARPHASASLTIPHGIKGGFRTKLKQLGKDEFIHLLQQVEENLKPLLHKSVGSRPIIYAVQRFFASRSSSGRVDAKVVADLRTLSPSQSPLPKKQPEWIEAIYEGVVNKRSNIQIGVSMEFDYDCPVVQSPEAVELFAESWIGMQPFINFLAQ